MRIYNYFVKKQVHSHFYLINQLKNAIPSEVFQYSPFTLRIVIQKLLVYQQLPGQDSACMINNRMKKVSSSLYCLFPFFIAVK
jgi:hypothetical protein